MLRKFEKAFVFLMIKIVGALKPGLGTKLSIHFYGRWGMKFSGTPNYMSSKSWYDGSDYSRIEIGEGVTISSYVSILTHDWALHTVGKALGHYTEAPLGQHKSVVLEDFCFIGRGSIIMPGAHVGKGSIIGAGAVVRGKIPEYSIAIGNPSKIIGSSKKYFYKKTEPTK